VYGQFGESGRLAFPARRDAPIVNNRLSVGKAMHDAYSGSSVAEFMRVRPMWESMPGKPTSDDFGYVPAKHREGALVSVDC
jgi:hypothetical protein